MAQHRIFTTAFSMVYPLYVQKAARKNRAKDEVDQVICWLTGYNQAGLEKQIDQRIDFETFFAHRYKALLHALITLRYEAGGCRKNVHFIPTFSDQSFAEP